MMLVPPIHLPRHCLRFRALVPSVPAEHTALLKNSLATGSAYSALGQVSRCLRWAY